jgi:hypothetical protein
MPLIQRKKRNHSLTHSLTHSIISIAHISKIYSWTIYQIHPIISLQMEGYQQYYRVIAWILVNIVPSSNEIKNNSYCTSANIKIFFRVQYSNDIWKNHILTVLITLLKKKYFIERTGIFSGSYKDDQDQQLNTRIYCMIFYKGLNREIFITI